MGSRGCVRTGGLGGLGMGAKTEGKGGWAWAEDDQHLGNGASRALDGRHPEAVHLGVGGGGGPFGGSLIVLSSQWLGT
jgi:hypothetical protein